MNLRLDQLGRCARPGCQLHTEPRAAYCPAHGGGGYRTQTPQRPTGPRANQGETS